jgi:hypothetical protein
MVESIFRNDPRSVVNLGNIGCKRFIDAKKLKDIFKQAEGVVQEIFKEVHPNLFWTEVVIITAELLEVESVLNVIVSENSRGAKGFSPSLDVK